jgi:UDP-N-acetyl-D-mannosaminuronic acid dehydrogenase
MGATAGCRGFAGALAACAGCIIEVTPDQTTGDCKLLCAKESNMQLIPASCRDRGIAAMDGGGSAYDATVVGCGTIGTAIGVALAHTGLNIALYDVDPERRATLASGDAASGEDEMLRALQAATAARRLHIVDGLTRQTVGSHYIVCTPTPVDEVGVLDSRALELAMDAITDVARREDAIFIRSTVPIGTTRRLAARMNARGLDLAFAATPDRSVEGRSFVDQFCLPQLIGGIDARAAARAAFLFAPLGRTIDLRTSEAAEAAKLFANAWRAALFATSNAMALACEWHRLDAHAIYAAASDHYPRFAPPRPGPVGGPCLLKDVRLLTTGLPREVSALIRGVMESEAQVFARMAAALDAHMIAQPQAPRIALFGIAFKGQPAVSDTRGSVALALARHLWNCRLDAVLTAWDPALSAEQIRLCGLNPAESVWEAARAANLVLFCNDHPELGNVDIERLARTVARGALVYDISGVTRPLRPALPNGVRHHILGLGEAIQLPS